MNEVHGIDLELKMFWERQAATAVKAFNRRNIEAWYVPTRQEALGKVMEMIPEGAVVGTADSLTLVQVGVFAALWQRGKNEVINPFRRDEQGKLVVEGEARTEQMRRVFLSDVYVIGTNAITLDGKLVNSDAMGNRVAPMIFGPKKVIVVVGANKITKNADEARAAAIKEASALDERKAALTRQFANMEQTLSRLKASGDYATSSLSSLISGSKS